MWGMIGKSMELFYRVTVLAITAAVMLVQPARALDRKDVQNCTQTVDLDRAIAGCTRALEARLPDNIRSAVYVSRGAVFEKKGDSDRAIADFSEAIRINPRSADAFFIRANAYSRAGDFDRAIADYNETIRIDPNHAKSYDGRGFAYYRKGEYDRTIADENEALRLDPKYANAYNNRGIAYGQKGDDDRAFADYDRAILIGRWPTATRRSRSIPKTSMHGSFVETPTAPKVKLRGRSRVMTMRSASIHLTPKP